MKRKKSKEVLLAEIAYAAGRRDAMENVIGDDSEKDIVENGARAALLNWIEVTGGIRKPKPTYIQRARKKWEEEGRPPKGTDFNGDSYVFAPNGDFLLVETFGGNLGSK